MWLIEEEIFQHPFTCILSGPTMCGKTYLLKEILKNNYVLINQPTQRIIVCYKAWQSFYDEFKRIVPNIKFFEGIFDIDNVNQNITNLIVFDDLMAECLTSNSVMNLFTVGSHHKNTSVFFISQNIFSKGKFSRVSILILII